MRRKARAAAGRTQKRRVGGRNGERPDGRGAGSVFVVAICFLMTIGALPSLARTLAVAQDIAATLRQAAAGDTVVVPPGIYRGRVSIESPIVIRAMPAQVGEGVERPIIDGGGTGDVVSIVASGVTVEGFEIRNSGSDMMVSDAGVKIFGSRATVRDNRLAGNLFGVFVRGGSGALIERNEIAGRRDAEPGSRGAGIHLYDTRGNTVRGNDVSYVRDGVYFDHADSNVVTGNRFHHLRYGVHYMYCDDNQFTDNWFHDSVAGVAIMYTRRVRFSGNRIVDNRLGYNAFGLLFQAAEECVAENNAIINNTAGVFLEGSRGIVIRNNLVAYNDVGVVAFGSVDGIEIGANDFIGNLANLSLVGKARIRWDTGGVGNHWSDYGGYDLDIDGVGDLPHKLQDVFEHLQGNHPLLRLYLSSPAAEALRLAERSFPVLPASDQHDRAPRVRPVSGVRLPASTAAARSGASLAAATACLGAVLGGVLVARRAGR